MATETVQELPLDQRFQFGANWRRFLSVLNDDRIRAAESSLSAMLGCRSLTGKRFIDVGSGSGLFSLCARRLGASVHSFDFDPNSVACTSELRSRYFPNDPDWRVERGSVLDTDYLRRLGQFDIVYSWGVLHHTGDMWKALANAASLVGEGGTLFIAIYNDQGTASRRWLAVKKAYNRSGPPVRSLLAAGVCVHTWWRSWVKDMLRLQPFRTWRTYSSDRGMSAWHDVVDWVGGYPFEVATPGQILDFYRERGFVLTKLVTCGGSLGCNQFIFKKDTRLP